MEPYLGEIRAVGFSFAPRGWALCNGALLQIRQSTALFALLGTTYGGDGRTTFGLPDLRGRAIVKAGQGTGLSNYALGSMTGAETVTLDQTQIPAHTHGFGGNVNVSSGTSNASGAAGNFLAVTAQNQYAEEVGTGTMAAASVTGAPGLVGGNLPHPNLQPYLALNYIISLQGLFPQRP